MIGAAARGRPHAWADALEALQQTKLEEVETLYRLARIGNMRSIRERAERLEAEDERYRSFAQRLQVLASRFQSRAILDLIAQCREQGTW